MAIFDKDGNYVKDSPDGKDYWLSDDKQVSFNENGEQVDSNGNVAFGSFDSGGGAPARPRWRPVQVQAYRPPNLDIHKWRT